MRAVAIGLLLAVTCPARADVELGARPELHLGAGYDDNLFLDAQPTGPNPAQIASDAIFDVQPRLTAWLNRNRHTLTLTVDYLERITPHNLDLRDLALLLDWRLPPVGPLALSIGGRYEHWATDQYTADTFDLAGVDFGLRVALGNRVVVGASYRFSARVYSDRPPDGQTDLDQRARAFVTARLSSWFHLELGYSFLNVSSNVDTARIDYRNQGELALLVTPVRWLQISAGYSLAGQHVPFALNPAGNDAPRDDLLQSFEAMVTAQPVRWLELFARYSLIVSSSNLPSGTYHRNQIVAGFGVRWDFTRRWVTPPPLAPLQRSVAGQTTVSFRHRAPPGHQVAVVGDWNEWRPQPLAEGGGGMYEGAYTVPRGRHEYAVSVDGVVVPPADAAAYAPDGFGGKSGILHVE